MNRRLQQQIGRTADSATWFLFARTADDRLRSAYSKALLGVRRREVRRRIAARDMLQAMPPLTVPEERGFAPSRLGDWGEHAAVVDEVQRYMAEHPDPQAGVKPYLVDIALRGLDRSSALMRFALDPAVLATVSQYMGMVPRLAGVTILESRAQPGEPKGSQLFHCDYEDVRQVKIFVHCSDTQPENGPLCAIPAAHSWRIKQSIHYRYGGRDFRVPDSVIAPLLPAEEIAQFTGPEGSLVFIDTSSCFHYGSRIAPGAGGRLMVQFQYLSPAAFELLFAPGIRRPVVADAGGCTELERLVLGAG